MRLKGKTALISGAGRNSGKAIALTFASEGADLILIARQDDEALRGVASQCERRGANVISLLADMSQYREVNRVVEVGLNRFGKVDVVASVAGVRPHKPCWEYDYEEWHSIFALNLHATFYLAKALAPNMIERKSGSIIALGSVVSMTAHVNSAVEVASKHGLFGLIKALAMDFGQYGVRANLLALSNIENEVRNPEWYRNADGSLRDKHSEANLSAKRANTPLRRMGKPQEVANAALFLACEESSYITGTSIVCGGGRYM